VAQLALFLTIFATSSMAAVAQSAPAQKKSLPAPATQESKDPEAVRSELFELLRLSPKLTSVIAADPTLLADESYVNRTNPELGEFLRSHPEVVRNPEFYLFLPPIVRGVGGRPILDVQGFRGPARQGPDEEKIAAFLVFVSFLAALLWIFRIVIENSKWNKLSKMQNDLYSKMLDKCGTNEELLASFRTSAGKPFFDLAAIEPHSANPLNRVFLPLQLGIVLTLAGGGLLSFLYARAEDARLFLGLGTLVFMVGIGLIISAAASYFLARHLGLLPRRDKANVTNASAS
jgi:hypothetical protein